MRKGARGKSWLCVAALSLACGERSGNAPRGASGAAGAQAAGGSSAVSGAGGSIPGKGGSSTAGSGAGGSAPASGGSGGASGSVGATAGTSSGGSTSGDAGAPAAGDGGTAGAGGAPPFTSFAPVGEPIELDGIVNASDIAWKPSTDTFFLLTDRTSTFHEYPPSFEAPVRTITLVNPPVDAEGLAYLGEAGGLDRFALAVEADEDELVIFELDPDATTLDFETAVVQTYVPGAEPSVANKGWEGVAYRPAENGEPAWLWACQEGEPGQVPIRVVGFPYVPNGGATLSYTGSLAVEEPWDAADALGAVAGDLSGLTYDAASGTLLVLSHLGSRLLRVSPATGQILDTLVLDRSPQYEGVTLARNGRLVLVSEPNFVELYSAGN